MAINRKELVRRNNPILTSVDPTSPLTVGNGNFAFSADVTGLQSFYETYRKECPLCTLSSWGWHTMPAKDGRTDWSLSDYEMTSYKTPKGRTVRYPQRPKPGYEEMYSWLRRNPHRLNLARIAFSAQGEDLKAEKITDIRQELDLYSGLLTSHFVYQGKACDVQTVCDAESDSVSIKAESDLFLEGKLSVKITFPYGASDISGSNFEEKQAHRTSLAEESGREVLLLRELDLDHYAVRIVTESGQTDCGRLSDHEVTITGEGRQLVFTVSFAKELSDLKEDKMPSFFETVKEQAASYWNHFFEEGGMIQVSSKTDPRADELQRRMILSMYLLAVNCSGDTPPQETGLTCNSWYGKMHLEMHFWHSAWAPLWNRGELLERSLSWYEEHLPQAEENAARNGYRGARWPKMIADSGTDSPSPIAPLLIWQQPHIIMMLELLYRTGKDQTFLKRYWNVVKETADFMADFVVKDEKTGVYDILPPVIPVQECHAPEEVKNPVFEVEYWKFGLMTAVKWAERLGITPDPKWEDVSIHMAEPANNGDVYLAHENCPDTFTKYAFDHPSMLMAYGVLPGKDVDPQKMKRTLEKVLSVWDLKSLWGWDFAVMAMTCARLGDIGEAIDILLMKTWKNDYVTSGNNRQQERKDLPLYLPGNGSLLIAAAAIFSGTDETPPLVPDGWQVTCENMNPYL